MCALPPHYFLVVLGAQIPEVLGDVHLRDDEQHVHRTPGDGRDLFMSIDLPPQRSPPHWQPDGGGCGVIGRSCPSKLEPGFASNAEFHDVNSVHRSPDLNARRGTGHRSVPLFPHGSQVHLPEQCSEYCSTLVSTKVVYDITDDEECIKPNDPRTFTLILSMDNIAALSVMASLSLLGAIYLWKLCTRRRCVCRLCRNHYRTHHLLGSGGYGSVYLVDRPLDGTCFVSKKIPVREITEVDEYSLEAKELIKLRHKHIVSYEEDFVHVEYGALEPKTFFIIIMEYCPEGDLKEKIEQDFANFTEDWVRTVFAQLLQAVQYLHSKNVIHRDLKSQNVFLAHDGHVRLGDFGLCRHTQKEHMNQPTLTHAGTDCYMAPEMLSSSRYGKPADVWSLGCVLYELCTGQFMWELDGILGVLVMKDANIAHKLLQLNAVPAVGKALRTLTKRLLSLKPYARPTVTECIRKKLLKKSFPLSRQLFGESLGELEPSEGTKESETTKDSDDKSDSDSSEGTALG